MCKSLLNLVSIQSISKNRNVHKNFALCHQYKLVQVEEMVFHALKKLLLCLFSGNKERNNFLTEALVFILANIWGLLPWAVRGEYLCLEILDLFWHFSTISLHKCIFISCFSLLRFSAIHLDTNGNASCTKLSNKYAGLLLVVFCFVSPMNVF